LGAAGYRRWNLEPRRSPEGLPSNARVRYSAETHRGLGRNPSMSPTLVDLRRRSLPNRVGLLPRRITEALRVLPILQPSVLRWTENHSPGAVAVPSGCSIGAVAVHEIGRRSTSAPVRPLSPQFIGAVAVRLYNHSLCTVTKDGREAVRSGRASTADAGAEGCASVSVLRPH